MATPFATNADVKARWPSFPTGEETYADTLCGDASRNIRNRWNDVDARIASGALDAEDVKQIVAYMVKRAMRNENSDGVEEETTTVGPFGESRKYSNPDGNLYFTAQDIKTLDGKPEKRAFTVDLSSGVLPEWRD